MAQAATKGCMQQGTGSAQSINLPMSNLWHSDMQGYRQSQTDKHTEEHVHTFVGLNLYLLPAIKQNVTAQRNEGTIYSNFEVFGELSGCQSFECSCGLNVHLTP